tara:strand:- start:117 stop:257 length:141 start_codon:yes stop_codon:yes gene_type:complete
VTKLEELKAAEDAACDAAYKAADAWDAASDAYQDELKRTQEENSDG